MHRLGLWIWNLKFEWSLLRETSRTDSWSVGVHRLVQEFNHWRVILLEYIWALCEFLIEANGEFRSSPFSFISTFIAFSVLFRFPFDSHYLALCLSSPFQADRLTTDPQTHSMWIINRFINTAKQTHPLSATAAVTREGSPGADWLRQDRNEFAVLKRVACSTCLVDSTM